MSNIMPANPARLDSVHSCFAYGLQPQEAHIEGGGAGERLFVFLFLS